jgi:hypothetical protein
MILGTLIDELERRDLRDGLARCAVGGCMGIAPSSSASEPEGVLEEVSEQTAVRPWESVRRDRRVTLGRDPSAARTPQRAAPWTAMGECVDALKPADSDAITGVISTSARRRPSSPAVDLASMSKATRRRRAPS